MQGDRARVRGDGEESCRWSMEDLRTLAGDPPSISALLLCFKSFVFTQLTSLSTMRNWRRWHLCSRTPLPTSSYLFDKFQHGFCICALEKACHYPMVSQLYNIETDKSSTSCNKAAKPSPLSPFVSNIHHLSIQHTYAFSVSLPPRPTFLAFHW